MLRGNKLKLVASYLLLTFVFQIITPTITFALTGGPSSPEVAGFTPVGNDNLVDLSTGDFSYSLPLMTVPGPNGGYPITMGYKSGITMEQEASWVGLGWDLNVGSINRSLRGLPDDFDGDLITKKMNYKDNVTIGAGAYVSSLNWTLPMKKRKLFGQEISLSAQEINFQYNNFTGWSISPGSFKIGSFALTPRFGNKDGISLTANYNLEKTFNLAKYPINLKANFNSAQGLSDLNFRGLGKARSNLSIPFGNFGFARTSPIGEIQMEQNTISVIGGLDLGSYISPEYKREWNGQANVSTTTLKDKTREIKAYGYNYLESASTEDLMDFHKEGGQRASSPVAPMPVLDYDIYNVTGHGVSGSFRAYRGDIPMLHSSRTKSRKTNVRATAEYGASTHVGGNIGAGYGGSSSGKWGHDTKNDNGDIQELEDDVFLAGKNSDRPLYQSFYFDFLGKENKTQEEIYSVNNNDQPVRYNIDRTTNERWVKNTFTQTTRLSKSSWNKGVKTNLNAKRPILTKNIAYRTKKELQTDAYVTSKYKHVVYPGSSLNDILSGNSVSSIDYNAYGSEKHINEISVTNTNGMKYVYGLPAYNIEKKEATFSVKESEGTDVNTPTIEYDANDASVNNDKGNEHYFQSTEVPAYVYAHLLTATYSSDYVDLKQDGPTEDDLGYWCKFNYEKLPQNYQWRAPFRDANYAPGNFSNLKDGKGIYSYGKREQYYVNSIETKTHIAKFYLSDRKDAHGVSVEHQEASSGLGAKSKQLDSIALYSKADLSAPVKMVHFEYDNSLCKNVLNATNGEGKLTLKKVWFTYQKNQKGELTPYEFEYGNGDLGAPGNPNYSYMNKVDRWGNYQTTTIGSTKNFPYRYQNKVGANLDASAWNLTKITMPSGGNIEIDYEADSYGFVQTAKAKEMYVLEGFAQNNVPNTHIQTSLLEDNKYMFFTKQDRAAFANNAEVLEALDDIKRVYFKAYVELKKDKNEYISGYLPLADNLNAGILAGTNDEIAFVEIKPAEYGDGGTNNQINSIQKAVCQHIVDRVDLQQPFQSPVSQINRLIGGPVSFYKKKHYGEQLGTLENSFIRLNSTNGEKLGGGSRVKGIRVHADLDTIYGDRNYAYGTKYSYKLKNGNTSGVADYEPITGGEENGLREPVNFNDVLDYNSYMGASEFFVETPFSESFYPSPVVRYSRVVTESMTPQEMDPVNNVNIEVSNLGGITVNEFYTSKDFPVYEAHTDKDVVEYYRPQIPVPFGLDRAFKNSKGTSQGFVVELNDMSGKPKTISTYDYANKDNLNDYNIKTKVEYIYHVKDDATNRIDANTKVLTQDGVFIDGNIGRKEEFYVYQHEDIDYNAVESIDANVGISGSVLNYITIIPQRNRSFAQRRLLVTNKVIYKTGILKEVRTFDNGRSTVSKNLAYDAQTGEALVQVQENDFNAPIYSYNYPGHWKYDALGGKYQNYRARFQVSIDNDGCFPAGEPTGVSDFIGLGDVLRIENSSSTANIGKEVYVTEVNNQLNRFSAKTLANGNLLQDNDIVTVIKSGYQNMQSVKVGSLVSTKNPLDFVNFNTGFIQDVVNNLSSYDLCVSDVSNAPVLEYDGGCDTVQYSFNKELQYVPQKGHVIYVSVPEESCGIEIYLRNGCEGGSDYISVIPNSFRKDTETTYSFKYTTSHFSEVQIAAVETNCDFACDIEGILHASATELTEDLNYDYADAGNPIVQFTPGQWGIQFPLSSVNLNPYAFGKKNIWRPKRSWVYQVDRKQSENIATGTEIDKDGEYEKFKFFNWYGDSVANEKRGWTWTNQMTKYSPYGFDIENKNPLNIHSTEMYGTNHSTVIAKAANARNNEIAFESFEGTSGHDVSYTMNGHFVGGCKISNWVAHTGNTSMYIREAQTQVINSSLALDDDKKYILSFWMYVRGSQGADVTISNTHPLASYTHNITNTDLTVVDNWAKIDIPFTLQPGQTSVSITFTGQAPGGGFVAIDDIRIHPFNAAMNTYVYDSKTLKVTSELDHLNFATFYNYDEEGGLVQVKKETEKGIFTVKTSRSNIAHQ